MLRELKNWMNNRKLRRAAADRAARNALLLMLGGTFKPMTRRGK